MGSPETRRPAPGGYREAGQKQVQDDQLRKSYPTTRSHAKRLIVAAGARGFLPPRLAEWIIHYGGLRHE